MAKIVDPDKDKLVQVNFRMDKSEYDKLTEIFIEDGNGFSAGMRKLIKLFLKKGGKL